MRFTNPITLAVLVTGLAFLASPAAAATGDPPAEAVQALERASTEPVEVQIDQNVPRFVSARVPVAGADAAERAYAYLERFRDLYGVDDPRSELRVAEVTATEGVEHVRLTQQRDGVPVDGAGLVVHLVGGDVVATEGIYLADVPAAIASIGAKTAVNAAAKSLGVTTIAAAKQELRYFDADLFMTLEEREASKLDGQTHLAWVVDLDGAGADGRPISSRSFVDAATGHVLFGYDLVEQAATDLWIRTANGGGGGLFCSFPGATDWFDENGVLPNVTPDAEGFGAFTFANRIYDYFNNTFHRRSYGSHDEQIRVNLDTSFAGNARWVPDCNYFEFGNNMATLDVMAHEFTHAVTDAMGGPGGTNQPGALDESYSDVFAAMIDTANWTIGEGTVAATTGTDGVTMGFRSLSDPTLFGDPDRMSAFRVLPATRTGDFGGVHTNNGITNKAAFLIAAGGLHNNRVITGIGRSKTERLYYEVLDNWLTSTSNFADAGNATTTAARLWAATGTNGFTRANACAVENALAAVELDPGDADCDGVLDTIETDDDNDGRLDGSDNCPEVANPGQGDADRDGTGDACELDDDNDGLLDTADDCPLAWNPGQTDTDHDGRGDACDPTPTGDDDLDGADNATDNCPLLRNPSQADFDGDGLGDACDDDDDGDGVLESRWPFDNCVPLYNPDQKDTDGDGLGDACDPTPKGSDNDGDGVVDDMDPDDDNDGVLDGVDNCQFVKNASQIDTDHNGVGTACDQGEFVEVGVPREIAFAVRREYFERLESIELPLQPCLERTCVYPDLTIEITSEIALPVQIVDREGKVLAEAEPGLEQRLVLPAGSIEGDDREPDRAHYFLKLQRTPDLEPEREYRMAISAHPDEPPH